MKTTLLFLFAFSCSIFAWNNHWEQTNSPYGGRGAITDVAINSKGYIFAGYAFDLGIFRSTDNGVSWEECNNGLTGLSKNIHTITINSKDCILLETKAGLYRSTDDGEHWIRIINASAGPLTSNSRGDFFGAGHIFGAAHSSIYRSTDNGDTWMDITNGLIIDNNLGAMSVNSKDDIFVSVHRKGIFMSTNNGDSWTNINNGLAGYDSSSLLIYAIGFNSEDQIFLGVHYSYHSTVFKSTNNGSSWTSSSSGIDTLDGAILSIAFNSKDVIFLGGSPGTYRSTDGGENWTELNNYQISKVYEYEDYPVPNIVIDSNDDIFAGNQWGVFKLENNGDDWKLIGISHSGCNLITINSNDNIFGAFDIAGLYRSTNNGLNWTMVNDANIAYITSDNLGYIYFGTGLGGNLDNNYKSGIFLSTDNGDSWTDIYHYSVSQNDSNRQYQSTGSIAVSSNGHIFTGINDYLYQYEDGGVSGITFLNAEVIKSTDNGISWITTNINVGENNEITSMAINSNGVIFVGTKLNGIYRSTDEGLNWNNINNGLGTNNTSVNNIAINSNDDVYASLQIDGALNNSIYKSTDYGDNWNPTGFT